MMLTDTIAAISTSHGKGAIGIVRVSGPRAYQIVTEIFQPIRSSAEYSPHKMIHGKIVDNGEIIDEVLIVYAPQGQSYTNDDLVEIHAHGNPFILSEILEMIVKRGARLANPGEFTFRCFMNGRLDLAQAEAVIDVIQAKSKAARRVATQHLVGEYSVEITAIKNGLVEILAHVEAAIDFTTEDIEVFSGDQIRCNVRSVSEKIVKILNTYKQGRLMAHGVQVALVGRPNVGKSSLLNAFLNSDRAIVTPEAGTTRDTIEEEFSYRGLLFHFSDTAGIRKTESLVEKMGIDKTMQKIKSADVVLLIVDASEPLKEDDFRLLDQISSKQAIVVANKIDLCLTDSDIWNCEDLKRKYGLASIVRVSALQKKGIEQLLEAICDTVLEDGLNSETVVLAKARHKEALEASLKFLKNVEGGLEEQRSLEFVAIDLRDAVTQLDQIIGRVDMEDIYDKIFSSFCIGK